MFSLNRNNLYYFDWISFALTLLIASIGLFFIMSATYLPDQPYSLFFKKQCFGLLSGLIIYACACMIDFRILMRYGYFAYFIVIVLLCWTITKGSIGLGAQRWINIGNIFKLQPSELCKLLFPTFMSYYCYSMHEHIKPTLNTFVPIIGVLLLSFLLILKQPDLGTALIILFSGCILLFHAGFPKKWFLGTALLCVTFMPLSWHLLKPYQRQRLLVFLGQGDAQKERYQIEQSKIAIGSGGLYGKGHRQGTQNIFQFLPESRTDFIFAVVAEEWGFVGAYLIVFLFFLLAWRLTSISAHIGDPWTSLLALGITIHIILSAFINIAMVLGLLPIVGIPLPLMSYGLSNLWVVLASLGLFNGIAMRRFEIRS